jgi:hypothetical protein
LCIGCTPPPPLMRGRTHSLGGEGGGQYFGRRQRLLCTLQYIRKYMYFVPVPVNCIQLSSKSTLVRKSLRTCYNRADWLVVGLSSWNGGTGWCGAAIFFDFYLNAVYPMILVTLCVILYTRQPTTDSSSIPPLVAC